MKRPSPLGSCGYNIDGADEMQQGVYDNACKTGTELRRDVLKEVEKCVCRDRQSTYGDAEDNFADIALMASIVLQDKLRDDVNLDAKDVALFSACIKLARLRTSPGHLDNWVDLAGYAVCGGGILKREQSR